MSKYKGYIENFPEEVVEWMCDQQVNQGNPRNVRVFEKYKLADKPSGGFTWAKVDIPIECPYGPADFCAKVIEDEEFDLIHPVFPKKISIGARNRHRRNSTNKTHGKTKIITLGTKPSTDSKPLVLR